MQKEYTFRGVRDQETATRLVRTHCKGDKPWLVWSVFDVMHATEVDRVPRCDPDESDHFLNTHYWQSGKWCPRKPATASQIRRSWQSADRASGVSDGGNPRAELRRWIRAMSRRNRLANARVAGK